MKAEAIKVAISATLADLATHEVELGDLDAALGDGDLGVTVAAGSKAIIAALETLPDTATPVDIARACAAAFADVLLGLAHGLGGDGTSIHDDCIGQTCARCKVFHRFGFISVQAATVIGQNRCRHQARPFRNWSVNTPSNT